MTINSAALLNNRYKIIQTLGRGGFGETFLAIDTHLPSGKKCVIKQLKPIIQESIIPQWMCDRFEQEARILESLGEKEKQIPQLYAYFQEGKNFFLVQEWIDGITLTEKVEQEGNFSAEEVENILIKLLPVLNYVHRQNIVHRDLKPDNIIYSHQDKLPVLIDFGAVKEALITSLEKDLGNSAYSIAIGTPGYMSSEQAAGRPIYSSDLYSLGLTAIYLLTGKNPQSLKTDVNTGEILWRQEIPELHSHLATVIDRSIRFNPCERFASAQEMLDALQPEKTSLASVNISSPKNNNSSIFSRVKTKVVVPNSVEKFTSGITSKTNRFNSTTSSDERFSLSFPAFFPWFFLSLIAVTGFLFGYQLLKTANQNQDNNLQIVQENLVEEQPDFNQIKEKIKNEIDNIDEPSPEETEDNSISANASSTETPIDSSPSLESDTSTSNNRQQSSTNITPGQPKKISSPRISPIGLSAVELNKIWGQPSYKSLAYGDRVTVVAYNNPQAKVKQIKYLVSNQNSQVVQVELIVSPTSNIDFITARVNQSIKGNISPDVQGAIQEVLTGQTDLRSFNFGKYQGMVQKRNQKLEVRVWDRQFTP